MIEIEPSAASPAPANRSAGALILFLVFALLTPVCLLVYHLVLWSFEQQAIASSSFAQLAWAGPIGLAVQAKYVMAKDCSLVIATSIPSKCLFYSRLVTG